MTTKPAVPKNFIDLPSNLILSREGLEVMSRSKTPITRIITREGTPKEGIVSESFNAPVVQKLIMNSYIDEIYVSLPDLLSKRHQVMSTNNLVLYAILYKKLTPSMAQKIIESPILKDFNRKNPKAAIHDFKSIPQRTLDEFMAKNRVLLENLETEIMEKVTDRINSTSELNEEDKTTRLRALDKFIRWVDKRIWYLYLIIYKTPLKIQIENAYIDMIYQYLDLTQIATHTSNLVMEFIQNAEKAHFERLIVRNNLATQESADAYLREKNNRAEVIRLALRQNQKLDVSWVLAASRNNIGKAYRIQVLISNYGIITDFTRNKLARKMKTNVEGIALNEFFTDSGSSEKLGAGLGLLYNSYLEDICRDKGIRYFCTLYPEPKTEKTTVSIEITL